MSYVLSKAVTLQHICRSNTNTNNNLQEVYLNNKNRNNNNRNNNTNNNLQEVYLNNKNRNNNNNTLQKGGKKYFLLHLLTSTDVVKFCCKCLWQRNKECLDLKLLFFRIPFFKTSGPLPTKSVYTGVPLSGLAQ